MKESTVDELEALRSVFGEDHLSINGESSSQYDCVGNVLIDFTPLETPLKISGHTDPDTTHSIAIVALPSINLKFCLSADYPDKAPDLTLDGIWINKELEAKIMTKMTATCAENLGMPLLFFVCATIQDEVHTILEEFGELKLDDGPVLSEADHSVEDVLKLIKQASIAADERNFEKQCHDCEVCFENKTGKDCVRFTPCQHIFCKECVCAYYLERINQQIRQMDCLSDDCESVATQAQVLAAIGEDHYERYERILLDRALNMMQDVVDCARPSCQKPVLIDASNPMLGQCAACAYVFCTKCKRTYHALDPCRIDERPKIPEPDESDEDAHEEWAVRMQESYMCDDWVDSNTKRCPICFVPIEKSEGCNKMTCGNCRGYFCFLCGQAITGYEHFRQPWEACYERLFDLPPAEDAAEGEAEGEEDEAGDEVQHEAGDEAEHEAGDDAVEENEDANNEEAVAAGEHADPPVPAVVEP